MLTEAKVNDEKGRRLRRNFTALKEWEGLRSEIAFNHLRLKTGQMSPQGNLPTDAISLPSINIFPSSMSASLNKATAKLDLPAPVLPAIPIFSCGFIDRDTPLSTSGRFGRYLSYR